MPTIVDNNFTSDSHAMRAERLNAIQTEFAAIQPELAAPAAIATWAEDCYDVYMQIWSESGTESYEFEGATLDAFNKGNKMEEEYQNARNLAITLYEDDEDSLKDFGFHLVFPADRQNQINRVFSVLDAHAKHVAEGITHLLPATIITRLTAAANNFSDALKIQKTEMDESRHAVAELKRRFDSDSKKLQSLRAWWYAMIGKTDERIGLIGMVNPQSGGGGSQIAAPQNLRYQTDYMKVVWDAVENATSYQLEISNDGVNYSELVSQSENEFSHIPYDVHSWFRVRSRSSAGLSEYSSVLQFWYYEPLPAPSNFQAVIIPGHQFKLSWDLIHSVTSYKIYISDVPFGEPESVFAPLYETSALEYTGSVTPGRRYYFKVTCLNNYQPESSYSSTEYIEITGV